MVKGADTALECGGAPMVEGAGSGGNFGMESGDEAVRVGQVGAEDCGGLAKDERDVAGG